MAPKESVVILGGGIAALSAAWRLRDQDVVLLEATSRLGGWIQTIEKEGFLFELGPRSCRTYGNGRATLELIHALGMEEEIIPASPEAQIRYLLHNQKLTPLPAGLLEWLVSPFFFPLVKGAFRDLISPSIIEDCSIETFIKSRMGKDVADFFVNPLVSGIYAGSPENLSIQSCFPQLFEWQLKHRSILKGLIMSSFKKSQSSGVSFPLFTLRRGLHSLVQKLGERLGPERIRLNSPVRSVEKEGSGWKIHLETGETISCSRVVSALPAPEVERLFQFKTPPMSSVAVVNLGYRLWDFPHKGFGYLVPQREQEKILGVVWDSVVFPSQQRKGEGRLTVMIGGTTAPVGWEKEDHLAIALEAVDRHMGIQNPPDVTHVSLARAAIPQYEVGYEERKREFLHQAKDRYPGIAFEGALFSGVAINDCVKSGMQVYSTGE